MVFSKKKMVFREKKEVLLRKTSILFRKKETFLFLLSMLPKNFDNESQLL